MSGDGEGIRETAPRWARALLKRLTPPEDLEEVQGDLEEAHAARLERMGRVRASVLTGAEALDMARAILRERRRGPIAARRSGPAKAGLFSGNPFAAVSWLDVKLGARMLVKHPALSLISALGIAVAVTIGSIGFGVIRVLTDSELTLDEGDRVVTVQNSGGFDAVRSTHLHDLPTWRTQASALGELGAYRVVPRNVVTPDGAVTPLRTIEMTASGFRVARVPPLLGRHLIDDDERRGAPPVAVIGFRVWQDRFAASPTVIGQTLLVGSTPHTIVGVMPEGFAFPINNRLWTPLKLEPLDYERGAAPDIDVFGRLAEGATLEEAQAQLSEIGLRAAAAYPETHENLQARVVPYAQEMFWGPIAWLLYVGQLFVSMLLMVVAINVAVLMYARTATRANEILVRTAIGASRSRIVTQLFAEALVLSSLAAALGLVAARSVLRRVGTLVEISGGEQMPFWWDFELSAATVVYAFALSVAFAVAIGVVPALGLTGRQLRARLQSVGGGGQGMKLGKVWTALIVAQVGVAVAVLPVALNLTLGPWLQARRGGPDYPVGELIWASLALDEATLPGGEPASVDDAKDSERAQALEATKARYARLQAEVMARLEADPELTHVVAMRPAPWQDPDLRIEVQDAPDTQVTEPGEFQLPTGRYGGWSAVESDFLEAFGIPLIAGRPFDARDVATQANVVIVSQSFVDRVLGGGEAVGRSIRPVNTEDGWGLSDSGAWFTIVGVVPDFPKPAGPLRPEPKVYQPLPGGATDGVSFAVRVRGGDPARFAPRFREIVRTVDPNLRLEELSALDELFARGRTEVDMITAGSVAIALSVLLLSIAGLYALMSFTIVGRRREIGIRAALGAPSGQVLGRVLARAAVQIGFGIVVGVALIGALDRMTGGGLLAGRAPLLLPGVALLMALVGLLAAWGPAREGLRIQPTEALRAE